MQDNQNNQYGNYYGNPAPTQPYSPQQTNPYNTQGFQQNYFGNTQMPMTFHTVYSVFLMGSGALSMLSLLLSLFQGEGFDIISLLSAAFYIVTGIFLYKRSKAGYVMRLINNIMSFVSSGFLIVLGFLVIFGGSLIASELASIDGGTLAGGLVVGLGVGCIIMSIASIIINVLIMKYYGKRKHMFN